jgi:hypothetical protein
VGVNEGHIAAAHDTVEADARLAEGLFQQVVVGGSDNGQHMRPGQVDDALVEGLRGFTGGIDCVADEGSKSVAVAGLADPLGHLG